MNASSKHLIVYTDGGSRGNPGLAGCGIYITKDDGSVLEKRYKCIGHATNNISEYTAAFLGIQKAIDMEASSIELRADSLLVIEQLRGNYKIKNPDLKRIYMSIQESLALWGGIIAYTHIPREKNVEADRLSNIAMDKGV